MRGPESRIYRRIKTVILEEYPGSFIFKVHGNMFQHVGIPDLIICLRVNRTLHVFVGIETKVPGKHATEAQENVMRMIRRAGGIAFEAHNVEEALELLDEGLKIVLGRKR